jgi:hypothetical protein
MFLSNFALFARFLSRFLVLVTAYRCFSGKDISLSDRAPTGTR